MVECTGGRGLENRKQHMPPDHSAGNRLTRDKQGNRPGFGKVKCMCEVQ